jgi:hypothetical protein
MTAEPMQFDHRFSFVWHTTWTEPCEKCRHLDGKVWTGQSLYQNILYDPFWGDIWDLNNDLPLTHTNCKCVLEVRYEATLEELLLNKTDKNGYEDFKIMTSNIKEMKADIAEFEKDLDRAQNKITNTRAMLLTYMELLRKAGLPPEVDKGLMILLRAKMVMDEARVAAYLLMAASGPLGWAMAAAQTGIVVAGVMSTASATQDLVMDLGGT